MRRHPHIHASQATGFPPRLKPFMTAAAQTFAARVLGIGMTGRTSLTIVLAAGEGTRMRSSLPKVLHPVASQPLLAHVLHAVPNGTGAATAVVIGPNHEDVAAEARRVRPDAATYIQRERLRPAPAALGAPRGGG